MGVGHWRGRVCWKCGKACHIEDKCRQVVNILAESIASPAVGDQPSWAHIVNGVVSVVSPLPIPPSVLPGNPQLFRNPFKASSEVLIAAKAALKVVVPRVIEVAPRAPVFVMMAKSTAMLLSLLLLVLL